MLIGVNDAWEDYCPDQYPPKLRLPKPHFREILRRFRAELPNAQLLLLTPFLTSTIPEKQSFHKILDENFKKERDVAAEFGYEEIIDLQSAFDEAEKTTKPFCFPPIPFTRQVRDTKSFLMKLSSGCPFDLS